MGDSVYLKLQPDVQSSVMYLSSNKLSLKFFGPLEILEKFPPATSAIHLVFHVSQLKIAFVIAYYYVIKWFVSSS